MLQNSSWVGPLCIAERKNGLKVGAQAQKLAQCTLLICSSNKVVLKIQRVKIAWRYNANAQLKNKYCFCFACFLREHKKEPEWVIHIKYLKLSNKPFSAFRQTNTFQHIFELI